jgi:hypothetical protein
MRDFTNQTFVHGIKTRDITKNNYYMPAIKNNSFVPANKRFSKDNIHRGIEHNAELDYLDRVGSNPKHRFAAKKNRSTRNSILEDGSQPGAGEHLTTSKKGKNTQMISGLSESAFAKKIDKMEGKRNDSLGKMMYSNDFINKNKSKISIYDYQKI